ncbi:MAG: CBS domain-containing protein [Ruminococcaceae bacterium]|nr:CBS domain-containing protein [Oscillospiraceae bacterium]
MRADTFLEIFRELEDLLEEKYSGKKLHYSSVVFEFLNSEDSAPIREKLDLCREIRNVLTHNSKLGGESVVEPSETVLNNLKECIEFIKKPPLALTFATPADMILKANLSATVLKTMNKMYKNGFSHVPVMENGYFVGVFSTGTVFEYTLKNPENPINYKTTIRDIDKVLDLSSHSENFVFAQRNLSSIEARKIFERVVGKNKRVSIIFITENGRKSERLLGLLTPWDLMGDK